MLKDSIVNFKQKIRWNCNNQLTEGRARFKYFPGAISNDLLFYIKPSLEEGQFDTAIIHLGIDDLLKNITSTDVLLQNILKIRATCKTHGISKIFVSSVLHTHEVSSIILAKLNLDIANICKSNSFHFIDKNNVSMNLLYNHGLNLLHSGKEILAKNFYFNINNFLPKHTYNPNINLN